MQVQHPGHYRLTKTEWFTVYTSDGGHISPTFVKGTIFKVCRVNAVRGIVEIPAWGGWIKWDIPCKPTGRPAEEVLRSTLDAHIQDLESLLINIEISTSIKDVRLAVESILSRFEADVHNNGRQS